MQETWSPEDVAAAEATYGPPPTPAPVENVWAQTPEEIAAAFEQQAQEFEAYASSVTQQAYQTPEDPWAGVNVDHLLADAEAPQQAQTFEEAETELSFEQPEALVSQSQLAAAWTPPAEEAPPEPSTRQLEAAWSPEATAAIEEEYAAAPEQERLYSPAPDEFPELSGFNDVPGIGFGRRPSPPEYDSGIVQEERARRRGEPWPPVPAPNTYNALVDQDREYYPAASAPERQSFSVAEDIEGNQVGRQKARELAPIQEYLTATGLAAPTMQEAEDFAASGADVPHFPEVLKAHQDIIERANNALSAHMTELQDFARQPGDPETMYRSIGDVPGTKGDPFTALLSLSDSATEAGMLVFEATVLQDQAAKDKLGAVGQAFLDGGPLAADEMLRESFSERPMWQQIISSLATPGAGLIGGAVDVGRLGSAALDIGRGVGTNVGEALVRSGEDVLGETIQRPRGEGMAAVDTSAAELGILSRASEVPPRTPRTPSDSPFLEARTPQVATTDAGEKAIQTRMSSLADYDAQITEATRNLDAARSELDTARADMRTVKAGAMIETLTDIENVAAAPAKLKAAEKAYKAAKTQLDHARDAVKGAEIRVDMEDIATRARNAGGDENAVRIIQAAYRDSRALLDDQEKLIGASFARRAAARTEAIVTGTPPGVVGHIANQRDIVESTLRKVTSDEVNGIAKRMDDLLTKELPGVRYIGPAEHADIVAQYKPLVFMQHPDWFAGGSNELRQALADSQVYMRSKLEVARAMGYPIEALELPYLEQMWDVTRDIMESAIYRPSGRVSIAVDREFGDYIEGIAAGMKPKQMTVGELIEHTSALMDKAIADAYERRLVLERFGTKQPGNAMSGMKQFNAPLYRGFWAPSQIVNFVDQLHNPVGNLVRQTGNVAGSLKNVVFGLFDVGVLGVQVARLAAHGGPATLIGALNRAVGALGLPNFNPALDDVERMTRNSLAGVSQSTGPSAVTIGGATPLQYIPKFGKQIDAPFAKAISVSTDIQFNKILTPLRNMKYEGNLLVLKFLGQNTDDPLVKRAAANDANAISGASRGAMTPGRKAVEGIVTTSYQMTRSEMASLMQVARIAGNRSVSVAERELALMLLASTFASVYSINAAINMARGESPWDIPWNPMDTNWATANIGGKHIPIIPQRALVRALGESVEAIMEMDGEKLAARWTQFAAGKLSPAVGIIPALAGYGYEPGEGFKTGGLSNKARGLGVAPLAPSIEQYLTEGYRGKLATGLSLAGVSSWPESEKEKYNARVLELTGKAYDDLDIDGQNLVRNDPIIKEIQGRMSESSRERNTPTQAYFDRLDEIKADFQGKQTTIDEALKAGGMTLEEWRAEYRTIQAEQYGRKDEILQAYGIEFDEVDIDKLPPMRAALAKYFSVDPETYRDAETGEVRWDIFFAHRDNAFLGLTTEQKEMVRGEIEKYDTDTVREYKAYGRDKDSAWDKMETVFEALTGRGLNMENPADRRMLETNPTLKPIADMAFGYFPYGTREPTYDEIVAREETNSGIPALAQRALAGDRDALAEWADKRSDFLTLKAGIGLGYFLEDFGEATSSVGQAVSAYYDITPAQFTQNGVVNWDAFFAAQDTALAKLDPDVQEAIKSGVFIDGAAEQVDTLYRQAREIFRDAPNEYRLDDESSRQLSQFRREVDQLAPIIAGQVGAPVQTDDVALWLAAKLDAPWLGKWYDDLQSVKLADQLRNPEFTAYIAQNKTALEPFFPDEFSQAALKRQGAIPNKDAPNRSPAQLDALLGSKGLTLETLSTIALPEATAFTPKTGEEAATAPTAVPTTTAAAATVASSGRELAGGGGGTSTSSGGGGSRGGGGGSADTTGAFKLPTTAQVTAAIKDIGQGAQGDYTDSENVYQRLLFEVQEYFKAPHGTGDTRENVVQWLKDGGFGNTLSETQLLRLAERLVTEDQEWNSGQGGKSPFTSPKHLADWTASVLAGSSPKLEPPKEEEAKKVKPPTFGELSNQILDSGRRPDPFKKSENKVENLLFDVQERLSNTRKDIPSRAETLKWLTDSGYGEGLFTKSQLTKLSGELVETLENWQKQPKGLPFKSPAELADWLVDVMGGTNRSVKPDTEKDSGTTTKTTSTKKGKSDAEEVVDRYYGIKLDAFKTMNGTDYDAYYAARRNVLNVLPAQLRREVDALLTEGRDRGIANARASRGEFGEPEPTTPLDEPDPQISGNVEVKYNASSQMLTVFDRQSGRYYSFNFEFPNSRNNTLSMEKAMQYRGQVDVAPELGILSAAGRR